MEGVESGAVSDFALYHLPQYLRIRQGPLDVCPLDLLVLECVEVAVRQLTLKDVLNCRGITSGFPRLRLLRCLE